MAFSEQEQVALAILPKISSMASLIGSLLILYEILVLDRRKLSRVYHRILLAMSLYDVLESSFNFQSSWPIPRGTKGVAFARGNTEWCEAQGFFLQFGIVIPILNMCLSIYYLLVIKYSWTEEDIRIYAEPWFHVVSLSVALVTAGMGLAYDLFNNSNLWCWYAPFPSDCLDSFRYGDEANCIRGDNAWIYRWFAYYVPLWFCILFVMVTMISVYWTVRHLEHASSAHLRRSIRHRENLQSLRRISSSVRSRSKSRRVATQAMWYVGAFYMTFLFATINRLVQQIVQETYFPLICFHAIFEPMQGLLNYLVYIRPRFLKLREQYPRAGPLQMLQMMVAVGRGDTIPAPDEHGRPLAPQPNQRQQQPQSMLRLTDDYDDEEEARSELKLWRRVIKFASRARVPSGTSTASNHEPINNNSINNNSINNNSINNNSLAQMDSHKEDMNHSASNDEGTRYPVSEGPQDTSSLELKALEIRLDDEIEELELLGSSFERRNRATTKAAKNDLRLNSSNSSSQRARNWLSFGLLRDTSFTRGEATRNLARTQSHGGAAARPPRRWSLVSFTESDRNMSNTAMMATQAEAEEEEEEEEENDTLERIREGDNNHVANGLPPSHEEFTDDEDIVDEDQDADQMASEPRKEADAARPREG